NISEQEYYENYTDEKNVIVNENGVYSNDELKGLERKETTGEVQAYIKDVEFIIVDNSIQYKYLKDWDLGDIVIAKDSLLDITINKSITEIEEFIEHTGTYITVGFKN
ncbi:MAG: siphovirus ReqiPepy6 Gp37-like family protein, partial [Eubacteriales bacterium]|nr:siphovirus ReqiPepy6 Gp37-like family protein [Eubacteriales bacterium]